MKNKKLRKSFKDKRCLVCNSLGCDFAHIKTYATTLEDSELNSYPLCRIHHAESHQIGIATFVMKYESVKSYVESLGFRVENVFGINKLVRENDSKD